MREKQLLVPAVGAGALIDSTVPLEGVKERSGGHRICKTLKSLWPASTHAPRSHFPDNHYPHPVTDEVTAFSPLEGESLLLPMELPHLPRHAASLDTTAQSPVTVT